MVLALTEGHQVTTKRRGAARKLDSQLGLAKGSIETLVDTDLCSDRLSASGWNDDDKAHAIVNGWHREDDSFMVIPPEHRSAECGIIYHRLDKIAAQSSSSSGENDDRKENARGVKRQRAHNGKRTTKRAHLKRSLLLGPPGRYAEREKSERTWKAPAQAFSKRWAKKNDHDIARYSGPAIAGLDKNAVDRVEQNFTRLGWKYVQTLVDSDIEQMADDEGEGGSAGLKDSAQT
jgi:hypothetical protein